MKRSNKNNNGYTILEVLIFLSISGFLMISAITVMGGRQSQVQYRQGITDLENLFSSVINDVSNGFFPSVNFSCSHNSALNQLDISAVGSGGQGTREACVFVGKAISLEDQSTVSVSTLAARRAGLGEILDFSDSLYTPINGVDVNLNTTHRTTWGIEVSKIYKDSNPAQELSYVAYITEQGSLYGGSLQSGNQSISLYSSSIPLTTGTAITALDRTSRDESIIVCLTSDSVGQNAVFVLGEDGRQSSILVERDAPATEYVGCGF